MHAKDFFVDDGGDGETVETISESFPQFDAITSLTFIIKPVDTVNGGTLVVTTENEEVVRIFDFVSEKKTDSFETMLSTIDVVTQKEVVGLGREVSGFEKTEEIRILTVDIT